jgi:hypothetical protein
VLIVASEEYFLTMYVFSIFPPNQRSPYAVLSREKTIIFSSIHDLVFVPFYFITKDVFGSGTAEDGMELFHS